MAEERGVYRTANEPEASQPDNVRTLPARGGFTQADNAYFDGLFGRVSPAAYYCLMYVVRNTLGYHRESVRLSFKQLGEALGISRNTAMRGIQELEAARIVGSDGDTRGRTQVRAYALLPVSGWQLPTQCPTSANIGLDDTSAENELVGTSAKSGLVVSKIGLVDAQTSPKIGLVDAQTSPKIGHLINKEKESKKETLRGASDDARVADDAHTPSKPERTPRAKRPRKLSDEQLEAHNAEAAWCSALLADFRAELDVTSLPNEGKERQAAHWFYDQLHAVEDGAAKVMICWRLVKRDPFWQNRPLSLQKLTEYFPDYRRDPKGFRERMTLAANPKPSRAPYTTQAEPARPLAAFGAAPINAKPPKLD